MVRLAPAKITQMCSTEKTTIRTLSEIIIPTVRSCSECLIPRHPGLFFRLAFFHLLPFVLISSILEPYFHLSRRQFQTLGHLFSFWCGEVLLLLESSFQFVHLSLRKQDPGFSFRSLSAWFPQFSFGTRHLLLFCKIKYSCQRRLSKFFNVVSMEKLYFCRD